MWYSHRNGAATTDPAAFIEEEVKINATMVQRTSATPDYTMGYSAVILETQLRATAETSAAHLLPHLRPGLRLLDFGCGPGTISVGLAGAVAPGEMHGVDMDESQIERARSVAASLGQDNAIFHVGDVTDLEFEDNFFDVAHCRSVLMHVPDTAGVLSEVKRVLKHGGLIACREMICESAFTHPNFGIMRRSWDMFEDLVRADDGHPQMGKDMKNHILEAGFTDSRMSASFSVYSSPEQIASIHRLISQWLLSHEVTEAAIKYGASSENLVEDLRVAYDRWKEHPAALFAFAYGEALANKPLS